MVWEKEDIWHEELSQQRRSQKSSRWRIICGRGFEGVYRTGKGRTNLKVYIEAAKSRGEALDHVLFYGPPGLGKTTLAGIIANEMGTNLKITSGPAIEKPGEMAAILNNLQENDVLFVDEIHRLNRQVEEVLYPAMEDFAIDIMIGKGASARSIRLDLPKFTLVGATTRPGMLTAPLRDRFGVVHRLEFYTAEELKTIILRSAQVLQVPIDGKRWRHGAGETFPGNTASGQPPVKAGAGFCAGKYDGVITEEVAGEVCPGSFGGGQNGAGSQ